MYTEYMIQNVLWWYRSGDIQVACSSRARAKNIASVFPALSLAIFFARAPLSERLEQAYMQVIYRLSLLWITVLFFLRIGHRDSRVHYKAWPFVRSCEILSTVVVLSPLFLGVFVQQLQELSAKSLSRKQSCYRSVTGIVRLIFFSLFSFSLLVTSVLMNLTRTIVNVICQYE